MSRPLGVVFALLGTALAGVSPTAAQLTTCALTGEFVASATLSSPPGPGQVGGTFFFTPAAGCQPGGAGLVTIEVLLKGVSSPYQVVRVTLPYLLNGNIVTVGADTLYMGIGGIEGGRGTSLVFIGGGPLVIAGSMTRRILPVASGAPCIAGPQGPAGPAGPPGPAGGAGVAGPAGPAGPAGATGPVGPSGTGGVSGPAGPAGPVGLPDRPDLPGRADSMGRLDRPGLPDLQELPGRPGLLDRPGRAASPEPWDPLGRLGCRTDRTGRADRARWADRTCRGRGCAGTPGIPGATGTAGTPGTAGHPGAGWSERFGWIRLLYGDPPRRHVGAILYINPLNSATATTEADALATRVTAPCTVGNLSVTTDGAVGYTTRTIVVATGSDPNSIGITTVSCTLVSPSSSCSTSNTASVAANDYIQLREDSGGLNLIPIRWYATFTCQ